MVQTPAGHRYELRRSCSKLFIRLIALSVDFMAVMILCYCLNGVSLADAPFQYQKEHYGRQEDVQDDP